MKIENLGGKKPDCSEVVQGGQGRDPEQLVNECLVLGLLAIMGLGFFLIALILKLVQLGV
jgi:hypothetical protein